MPLTDFGSNPGALRAFSYIPKNLDKGAPLIVVLHGCLQSAAGYNYGSGWSQIADENGSALLFPEQQRQNNPNLCFNWFQAEDFNRGSGEALSVRQMVSQMVQQHDLDGERIFVTGLSAGGAMTGVMLAAYPDVFTGGAIIAGLPYGTASTVPEAFDRMRGHGISNDSDLGELVKRASRHTGPWPTVSIWHGDADQTVAPSNATAISNQWRNLHQLPEAPSREDRVDGHVHRVWSDSNGRDLIEEYLVSGMGHGTPLKVGGPDGCGVAGPYMINAGISSTRLIARFWKLRRSLTLPSAGTPAVSGKELTILETSSEPFTSQSVEQWSKPSIQRIQAKGAQSKFSVQKVIEDALRSAGLMK
jgi:poly(hydroxyalkanoate) depolymerase family esterase